MSLFFKRDVGWSDVFAGFTGTPSRGAAGRALRLVPVYAAVSQIADQFATLPQHHYVGEAGERRRVALPQWLANPDRRVNVFSWRYQFVTSLKLRGNAYGLVLGDPANPLGVRWLHPDSVSVDETDPTGPRFFVSGMGEPLTLHSQGGRMLHVPEFVQPGSILGLSPIAQFRQVFETAEFAGQYGRDWFEKSAVPASLLMSKQRLSPGQASEAKRMFRESVADGGPVTLDAGWDYEKLTVAPDEAQFLQTIKASATLIANIFRVPPEDIGGEVANSRTYGNREADAERFNVRTMLPLVTRYELAVGELLPAGHYLKLNMDVLSRPNLLERSRANTENLRNGTLTLGEARANEDRAPLTDEQVEQWQQWFATTKSQSESDATSTAYVANKGEA